MGFALEAETLYIIHPVSKNALLGMIGRLKSDKEGEEIQCGGKRKGISAA